MMRMLTGQMLEEHGYGVLEASDGDSALDRAGTDGKIDLMLTDVVMREMSGPELVLRLEEAYPEIKIVYMSGYTGGLVGHREQLRPGVNLLEKPFTSAQDPSRGSWVRVSRLLKSHTAVMGITQGCAE